MTNQEIRNASSPFELIAPYYDLLMEGVPYRFWLKYLESLWAHYNFQPLTVLDLACGTGTLSILLARSGFVVTGVDIAQPMLDQALKKAAEAGLYIDFQHQDASSLDLPEKNFDSVVSFFDSLNNITDPILLLSAFQQVRQHLVSKGLFIFDLNTAYAFKEGMFDQKSRLSDGPLQYNWTSSFDERSSICTINMKFTYFDKSNKMTTFDEVHTQRAYSSTELISMLEDAGFSSVSLYDAYSLSPPKRRSDRIFVVAIA